MLRPICRRVDKHIIATMCALIDGSFGYMQGKGPDSVADCVYRLNANVANIMVIKCTIVNLTITHHMQYQYLPRLRLAHRNNQPRNLDLFLADRHLLDDVEID